MLSSSGRIVWLLRALLTGLFGSALSQQHDVPRYLEEEFGEDEEEEVEISQAMSFSVVVCIVLLLILLTILFEYIKEYIEESASPSMKPIIEKLFGEMTVLGFLSAFTFIITQAGFIQVLSTEIYGESSELLEVFEGVHYTIFFVMVGFVIQVIILEKEAEQIEQEWLDMDRTAREESEGRWTERAASYRQRSWDASSGMWRRVKSFAQLLPPFRNKKVEHRHDELAFKALREEFLVDRDLEPPFAPAEEPLPEDFNFGRYLGICLGRSLAKVVEVKPFMWAFFAIATLVYYAFALLVEENETVLGWVWIGLAWLLYFFNVYFETHLISLVKSFVAKDSYYMVGQCLPDTESTGLLAGDEASLLPDWCNIDIDEYMATRSWWDRTVVGGKPNRQQILYWMDRMGPAWYLVILQINLIFVGLYAAMHILEFGPVMHKEAPLYLFIIYLVAAILPVLGITIFKKHLLLVLTPVCNVGTFRKPQVIAQVLLEEKAMAAVRTFIIVYKLQRFAQKAKPPHHSKKPRMHYSTYFDKVEISEVEKSFDAFDRSGDGTISPQEFLELMTRLGTETSDEELQAMVQLLDRDRSGVVTKDEFLQWYAENANEDHLLEDDFAEFLFNLFDTNRSGEITIGEFLKRFYALNSRFTVEDAGAIVKELDENDGGAVGLEEFEHFVHKYYPRELSTRSHH